MDVFAFRKRVVEDYERFSRSFSRIRADDWRFLLGSLSVTIRIIQSIVGDTQNLEIQYDENNPPFIFFDTNVWCSINDADIATLQRLQQKYGFRYRYSVTNFVELASHLEDQPSNSRREPFRVFRACFRRMHKICDPKILQSPEMVFLARAGLVHYIHPEWIPNITQIALKVESIVNANGPDELAGLDVGHYRYLRETDENSMTAIMGKLQAFKRPITQSDYDGLLEWFKILAGFFLFVRPTNGTIALRSLPADEQNRFGEALRYGLFMAHCMNLVKRTINDGRKVDSNDLYDMLQLILLDDDNALFVTREKNFFLYEIDQNKPKRVLRSTNC